MKVLLLSFFLSIASVGGTGYTPSPVLEKLCGVNKCRPREKCIDTVKEQCTEATCTKYPTCIPVQARECDAGSCPHHQVCLNVAKDCQPGQKCDIVKRCVSKVNEKIIEDLCTHYVCSDGYKCIETVTPTCEDATCTKYPLCVRQEAIACTTTTCSGQEVCVNVQEECKDQPCPISKKCLPPFAKQQKCGVDSCRPGEDCYELADSDCRVYNCPRYPTCLKPQELPCNKVDCGSGNLCVNIRTQCPYTACDTYARCVTKETHYPIREEVSCSATKCHAGQKCIDTVSPQCTDSGCTRFPSCVPRIARPCTGNECSPRQVCLNVQEECTSQPCPVSKKCVPYAETGGRCGGSSCKSNEVCIGGFQCDERGCQPVDVCLPRNAASCDGVRCIRGTSCVMIKDPYCTRAGCYPVPQCLFNTEEKEGRCPAFKPGVGNICIEQCSSDAECVDDLKCCSNGCGHVCTKPEWEEIQKARCPEPDCPSKCTFTRSPSDPCGTCYCLDSFPGQQDLQCGSKVCSQGEGCYQMAAGNCDYAGCDQRPTCLKQQEMPCNTVDCAPHTTCVNIRTDCPYTACDIYARCVPDQQKPTSSVFSSHNDVACGSTTCKAGFKCIEAVPPECIDATCTKFPLCVPEVARPCTPNECDSNHVCVNVQEKCPNQPCPVSKKCVPHRACSSANCGRNEECISAVQCDERGCQDTMACIPQHAPTCSGAQCRQHTECFMVKENNCRGHRCYPVPQCLFTGTNDNNEQCGEQTCTGNDQCEVVYQCPGPRCEGYKTCLPNNVRTCTDAVCKNCRMVQLKHCFAPPCPPEPYCDEAPGCETKSCARNEACIAALECSSSGCRKIAACLPLGSSANTCANVKCNSRTECSMVTDPQCRQAACYPVPQCLPKADKVVESAPDAPHGQCPQVPYNPLAASCVSDQSCPTGQKCCLMEGAHRSVCTPANYEGEKPGQCPSLFSHQQSSCREGYPSLSCSGDVDCPLNYKCCPNGCNNVCTALYSVKGR